MERITILSGSERKSYLERAKTKINELGVVSKKRYMWVMLTHDPKTWNSVDVSKIIFVDLISNVRPSHSSDTKSSFEDKKN